MLYNALDYEPELIKLIRNTWYDTRYKWYNAYYNTDLRLPSDDWNSRYFVSLDSDNNIVGFISYKVNRCDDRAESFGVLSFVDEPSVTLVKDTLRVVDDIFRKFGHRQLNYSCITHNPAYPHWKRFAVKCGGREVGVWESHTRLMDGKYYHLSEFEITAKNYFNSSVSKRYSSRITR